MLVECACGLHDTNKPHTKTKYAIISWMSENERRPEIPFTFTYRHPESECEQGKYIPTITKEIFAKDSRDAKTIAENERVICEHCANYYKLEK